MDIFIFARENPVYAMVSIMLLGAIVGSFINVVIYRLPRILEKDWRVQCKELLETSDDSIDTEQLSLVFPASRCAHCGTSIKPYDNIPIISYLLLKGRCRSCGQRISIRYPLIEFLTAFLSVVIYWQYGFSIQTVGGILFTWYLIVLTFIDTDTKLLPDSLTLPLIWLGLIFNINGYFTPLESSVIGAVSGYLSLWFVFIVFKLITGKHGMGYGDFKLFAAIGAWLGWAFLPLCLILASASGSIYGITTMALRNNDSRVLPFGPFLAAGAYISLVWGPGIYQIYFSL